MKQKFKKPLALLLTLAMCLSLLPVGAMAAAAGNNVVINQIYGGGGNSGAPYNQDFIELFNPTGNEIFLDGWSVQYGSAGLLEDGTKVYSGVIQLTGSIAPGGYYLVAGARGATGGPLPTPDAVNTGVNLSGTAGKVALVKKTTAISQATDADVVDFVGFGTTANAHEGSGTAAAPSNSTSIVRKTTGVDTDDNRADFQSQAPNPRNSQPIAPVVKVATPKATPAAGGVTAGTEVTLSCDTDGANIYYTTDGTTPAAGATGTTLEYTGPITIDAAKTVKAIAVKNGLDSSDVLEAAYTIVTAVNIAAARQAVGATTTKGVVTFIDGKSIYMQDSTAGVVVRFSTVPDGVAVGKEITVTGTTSDYNGLLQITPTAAVVGESAELPPAKTVTLEALKGQEENYEAQRIKLSGVTIGAINTGGNTPVSDGTVSRDLNIYKIPGGIDSRIYAGCKVDVIAIVSQFTAYQLRVADKADVTFVSGPTKVNAPVPAKESGALADLNEQIAVTCSTPGATIQFNQTSAAPEESAWQELTGGELTLPSVKGSYTYYLRATKNGLTASDVVTVTYIVGQAVKTSILEARKGAVGDEVFIQGILVGDNGNNLFMQDESAGIAIKAKIAELKKLTGLSALAVGQEISLRAKVIAPYNGLVQVEPLKIGTAFDSTAITIVNASPTPPTPIPLTVAALMSGNYEGRLVKLSRVTLSVNGGTGMKNHTILQNGVETTFRADLSAGTTVGSVLDIVGIASIFTAPQLAGISKTTDDGVTITAADGSTVGDAVGDVASWSPSDKQKTPADAASGTNKGGAVLSLGGATVAEASGRGFSSSGWHNGVGTKYWQIKVSTAGISEVAIAFDQFSSGTGPAAYQIKYSTDGTTFKNLPGGNIDIVFDAGRNYGLASVKKLPLPADAANQPNVYIRWVLASNARCKDASLTVDSGGTSQINGIVVSGREYYGPSDVAPVKATPSAGAVTAGSTVVLATATEGTTIRYTIDNSDPTAAVGAIYTQPVRLTELPMTIKAVAYKTADSSKISPVKTFIYTQAQVGAVTCNKVDGSKLTVGLDQLILTAEKGAVIKYIKTSKAGMPGESAGGEEVYNPATGIPFTAVDFPMKLEAWATKTGCTDGERVTFGFVLSAGEPKNYFGQLHSHTAENSDGAGTLEEAFSYAANQSGVDFLAVTDHSNSFDDANKADGPETYNLTTYNAENEKWVKGHQMAEKYTDSTFVGMYGYEMTWSGGPGHMNTFNTTGFVSRNNTLLNNKTGDKGMQAYYELLSRPESAAGISQFNHPGKTFGNFASFGYWNPVIDSRISLIEVGNGEGAIRSGGYFPSYSEYTLALDKGWHLAPTNNQDNHQKKWGDANNARTVVYTNDFTREGIYQALRDMRVYATEDKNLDIVYTLNGAAMGTILSVIPDAADIKVVINDPDGTDKIAKVEVITTGGEVAYGVAPNTQSYTLEHTMSAPEPGYYYIRVTQADEDIAVTAPIWLGAVKAVGMGEMTTDTYMAVKGEMLTLSTNFFNNEAESVTLKSLTYAIKGGATIATQNMNVPIASNSTLTRTFDYTPLEAGEQTVVLTAVIVIDGVEKSFNAERVLDVKDPDTLIYVGVDGSHYNEYVTGNYKDSMGNFGALAGGYDVRVNVLKTSEELINALQNPKYKMFVFTAPTRRLNPVPGGSYASYSDAELTAVATFAKAGGTVVVTGWGDYYESYDYSPREAEMQMAVQQNKLLAAIGSKLRLADDEAKDNDNNPGNNAARLYLTDYNDFKSPLLAGVNPKQVFSQYGGSTVFAVDGDGKASAVLPQSVVPVISGYGAINPDGSGKLLDKINSYDDDGDGYGQEMVDKTTRPPKYQSDSGMTSLLTATETVNQGGGKSSLVVVSGGAFMSNFEIKADVENAGSLNYSNYNFLSNLVESLNPPEISTIAQVTANGTVGQGQVYTIEGTVMTTVWNGTDDNTGFFDCIYVQDETGGINVFPVSSGVEPGQKVRITGVYDAYEGERQLQSAKVKVLSYKPDQVPVPREVTTKDVAEQTYLGQLVKVTGKVASFNQENGVVSSIMLTDSSGVPCKVFIDGYITKGKTIQGLAVGSTFIAIGLSSYNKDEARIRVRDRADVYESTDVPPSDTDTTVRPGDVKENESFVEVKLPATNAKFNTAASVKVVEANQTKPITITGRRITITIPAGTLSKGADVNAMLVNPNHRGNVIQVTKPDGAAVILPLAAVGSGSAAYVANVEGIYKIIDNTKAFPDIKDHWAGGAITFVTAHEFFKGVGDGSFAPQEKMTRGMLVTVLSRMDGGKTAVGGTFADVPAAAWYAKEVAWAAQNKLVEGDGTYFHPDATLTREQLCVILARYLRYSGLTLAETSGTGEFTDRDAVSPWADEAMTWAVKTGLISGKSDGLLDPQGTATRAEIAVILQRFVEGVVK